MKTIGLIGGMSWESTALYYQAINRIVGQRLGGFHSAKIVLHSVDFAEIEALQRAEAWDAAGERLASIARSLETAGAECLVVCANTMHLVAPQIEAAVSIPLLHIADATAERIHAARARNAGLLGTRFTMSRDFYRTRLESHGLRIQLPDAEDREIVDRIVFDELCHGEIRESSRAEYIRVIDGLVARGAEGIILGCTEIGMLIRPSDVAVPLFDTAQIHAEKAAEFALAEPAEKER